MHHCLSLARQGEFLARSNPMVGAVVVNNGQVVGQGSYERFGQAHAEINALRQAGEKARGATLYVSLEPCCITAKTGPCTEAVIAAGITEVVYAMTDPNPAIAGKGLNHLQEAGIKVTGPVLEEEAKALNCGFVSRMTRNRPWTRIKLAMSLDGRTAMASGESQWITGPEARDDVQKWRARSDAVITGIGTVLADNPSMNVRLSLDGLVQPLRVIVDSELKTPLSANILDLPGRVILATAQPVEAAAAYSGRLGKPDVSVISMPAKENRVDLSALLHFLAQQESCNNVLIESGPTLAGSFINEGLADELLTYTAPVLLGSEARPLIILPGLEYMKDRIEMTIVDVAQVGKDCRMRSLITSGASN